MQLIKPLLLESNKHCILENVKQAKLYVDSGKLSRENLQTLITIDPSSTKKYVGWMAKQWVLSNVQDIDTLRNTIEEFNTLSNKGKIKSPDINKYKSFTDLEKEVSHINNTGGDISVKDLESDYDTVVDTPDLLIMSPHTHEASRKLGLSHFAFRDCEEGKDSAWCTTYKASDHFNDYYYKNNVTFYYIKVRSEQLIEKLKKGFTHWERLVVVALAVLQDGQIDGYDGLDKQMPKEMIDRYTEIVGIT